MVVGDGFAVVALIVVVVVASVVVVVVVFVGATVDMGVVCILYNKFSMSFISKFSVEDVPLRVLDRSVVLIAEIEFAVVFVGRCVVVVVVVVNALVTAVISFDFIPASSNDESKLHDKSSFSSERSPSSASSNRPGSGFCLSPPNDDEGSYRSLNDEKSSNGSSTIVVRTVGCVLIILLLRIVVND